MRVAPLCWASGHMGHLVLDESPPQNAAVDMGLQLPGNTTSLFQWVPLRPVQQLCPLLVKHQSQKALSLAPARGPWGIPPLPPLWGPRKAGLTGDVLRSGQRQAEASPSLMHRDQEVLDENQRATWGRRELLQVAAPVKVHEVFWPPHCLAGAHPPHRVGLF